MDLPFRGCMSFGEFFTGKNSITGPAIFEAADYYEKSNWIGISLTPSAHRVFVGPKIGLVKYDIPLKQGIEKDGLALNINEYYERIQKGKIFDDIDNPNDKYKDMYHAVDFSIDLNDRLQKMSEQTNDLSATMKIRNTIAFVNHIKKIEK